MAGSGRYCPYDEPMSEPPQDPFETLQLPRRFDLEEAAVNRAWLVRAAGLHPDRAGTGVDAIREMAHLNAARETLRSPERRANVLLRLLGGPSKDADRSLPPGFLEQTLEMREQVETALAEGDPRERERIETWAQSLREGYIQRVSGMFAALPAPPIPSADLSALRQELNAWRYIERLIEQLDPSYDPAKADFTD